MAAAAALFDSLFRPSTQFVPQDENQQNFTEVALIPHLTLEAILATGITWDDFHRFLSDKVVRMARGVYVSSNSTRPEECNHVLILGDLENDSGGLNVDVRPGTATEMAMATCNFLVRLLAASEKREVYIMNGSIELLPVSGPTLSHLFERSRETLIKVSLGFMILNEEHIRALAIASAPRHELRLVLQFCRLSDNDACRNSFAQWLQSGGGPTELCQCHIDSHVLADSLKGNSRLGNLRFVSLPCIGAMTIFF
jgi:hypothetical protein